ncbi:MAG: hypothetical protein ABSC37_13790 [Xanthobacteraceae bacterium]
MENATTIQLAKQDDTEFRAVRLNIDSDGAIRMDAHDMGPTVVRVWDHEDYEFSVEVPASAVGRLAFELLREKFAGNLNGVSEFRNFCEKHDIVHKFDSWP